MSRRVLAPPTAAQMGLLAPEATTVPRRVEPEVVLPVAVQEVLGFKAAYLQDLSLHTVLVCMAPHEGGQLVLSTAQSLVDSAWCSYPTFVGREVQALIDAAENERGTFQTLAKWCELKREDPSWRLTSIAALGGILPAAIWSRRWTWRQVLRAYGAQLLEVHVCDPAS